GIYKASGSLAGAFGIWRTSSHYRLAKARPEVVIGAGQDGFETHAARNLTATACDFEISTHRAKLGPFGPSFNRYGYCPLWAEARNLLARHRFGRPGPSAPNIADRAVQPGSRFPHPRLHGRKHLPRAPL